DALTGTAARRRGRRTSIAAQARTNDSRQGRAPKQKREARTSLVSCSVSWPFRASTCCTCKTPSALSNTAHNHAVHKHEDAVKGLSNTRSRASRAVHTRDAGPTDLVGGWVNQHANRARGGSTGSEGNGGG